MWKQTKPFDQNRAGKEPGMCLKNTRLGYGITAKYDNAWQAWLNTERHAMRDYPAGVDVPIYFWYRDAAHGHIGVRLANGKFWTDGRIFDSVEAYEAVKAPNFVGWGESINEVRVIEYVADAPTPPVSSNAGLVGKQIQLLPVSERTTFRAGTTNVAGKIIVRDNSFVYTVRGIDPWFPNRVLINSASAGGDGVALALQYTNGQVIPGWKTV